MDPERIRKLVEFADDYQEALLKIKACAESNDPTVVAVLNQVECQATVKAIRASLKAGAR